MGQFIKRKPFWIIIFSILLVSFMGHLLFNLSSSPTAFLGLPMWMLYYFGANVTFIVIFYFFIKNVKA